MSKKRILIFSLSYYPLVAGAEVAIKEITERIPDIEFDMLTLRFSKKHPKFERVGNVNIYRIGGGFGYFSKILFIPLAFLYAQKLKKANRYNAFWAMMSYMILPVTLLRLLGDRTPYLLTLQDGDPFIHVFHRLRIFIWKPLLKYGFRHAKRVQTISHFLAGWAKRMGYEGDVEIVPNGVDIKKFENRHIYSFKPDVILITTSRLVAKNGVEDIINALKYLPKNVKLQILGVGPLESKLKNLAKSENLGSRVDFLGFVSQAELPKYLHKADIFVRPSLSEGLGISFIEAMAAGRPVIATPVGGIPDFLKDGETGLFCNTNDPKNIAEKVKEYGGNPELRVKIIQNAFKMVKEKYNWTIVAGEMKRIFSTLIEK